MIEDLDNEALEEGGPDKGPRAILLCTHAAGMICIGRALTGRMPEDVDEADFGCGTCALSVFVRRKASPQPSASSGDGTNGTGTEAVQHWDPSKPDVVPQVPWVGKGVGGGWDCVVNGDCNFLQGGEERSW